MNWRPGHEIAQQIIDYRFYSKVNTSYADLLSEEQEIARISRELVTLRADAPVDQDIAAFQKKRPDPDVLIPWLEEQGFKSALSRARSEFGIEEELSTPDTETAPGDGAYELVQDEAAPALIEKSNAGVVAFDTETTLLIPCRLTWWVIAIGPVAPLLRAGGPCCPGGDGVMTRSRWRR